MEGRAIRDRVSVGGIRLHQTLVRVGRRLLLPGSLGVGTIAVGYGVLQLLESRDAPSAEAWAITEPLGGLLVGTGIAALIGTLAVFIGYAKTLKKADKNDELYESCRAAWHRAVEVLGIDMKDVGVHVWGVRGFYGFRYLERRATFIIEPRRPTHVLWRRGKGAIGLAWEEDDPLVANVQNLIERGRTERVFYEIPHRERFGLTWREFKRARRYRAVLAVPLRVRGKVRGCLSVDVQVDGYADKLDTLLGDEKLNAVLTVCEASLAGNR
ncbi:MAG: hypothetical protein WD249_07490 [Gaiellaceae bacterium]